MVGVGAAVTVTGGVIQAIAPLPLDLVLIEAEIK